LLNIAQALPLYLLLLILPLGVAGQNIGSGVVGLVLFVQLFLKRHELPVNQLWREHGKAIIAVIAFLVMQVIATVSNPASPVRFQFNYIFGYAIWALLPPVVYLVLPRLNADVWRKLHLGLATVCVVLGVISLSQSIWGWRIVQTHVELGFPRAQGLYSHPMTFGYVCLILVPIVTVAVVRSPHRLISWVAAISLLVAIYTSRSRMVEVVTGLIILWNIWCATKGRMRAIIMAVFVASTTLILTTNNPVGERFRGTLHREDVRSDYVDDRVAFWHVHWNMLKERPLLGHGEGINIAYRIPYYEAIGLKGFIRQYEAHNMFLQLAVNLGLIGLFVFLWWLIDLFRFARRFAQRGDWTGRLVMQTIVALCIGALTQNAFQDSAVRFTITVLIAAFWLWARDNESIQTSPNGERS